MAEIYLKSDRLAQSVFAVTEPPELPSAQDEAFPSAVVAAVIDATDARVDGAVMFRGWLLKDPPATHDTIRFYTDPHFTDWLEIASKAILHQIQSDGAEGEGRSVIWVKPDTTITKCRSRKAHQFPETEDDPTVRSPRWG